jgi:hypothetical protein
MDERQQTIYIFRKLVYVLYLEIGALQPRIHPEIAEKADIKGGFFQGERARQAAELYLQTETEQAPAAILDPYQIRTGLTLEDIHRAFVEGDWKNRFGSYNFGGPKWVKIAEITLQLRALIEQDAWEDAAFLIHEIKGLKTNQGYLINAFERTERRRR